MLARRSLFLCCLLSLCILWRVHLSLPLCLFVFLFILLSFMFPPFLYMIMQSKGTRGTGLSAVACTYRAKIQRNSHKKRAEQPLCLFVFFFFLFFSTDRLKAVFWWPFAKEQPPQSMFSFIFTYGDHGDKQNIYRERTTSEKTNVRLTLPAAV